MKVFCYGRVAKLLLAAVMLLCVPFVGRAHSGKARFHLIVDTDCAADDLRALCMLLGNREVEVLAITTSNGALLPVAGAQRVGELLTDLYNEGIPIGVGRTVRGADAPWRDVSSRVAWGGERVSCCTAQPAVGLMARALEQEQERVVVVALGSLTNVADLIDQRPDLGERIERVVWYNDSADPLSGANFDADRLSAQKVFASQLPVEVVCCGNSPVAFSRSLVDSLATMATPYARKIVAAHRAEPLAALVGRQHLKLWDDLVVVSLFYPELFCSTPVNTSTTLCCPTNGCARAVEESLLAIVRGKTDSESRVFYGFPLHGGLYAADVQPIVDEAVACHGQSEWRAAVLTNELHGHLGVYATIGVKMGIRAREYFNIGIDDMHVVTRAGSRPPVSCMNDGLQVSTGASVGHGLISVEAVDVAVPQADFTFKDKTLRLTLKKEYAQLIADDIGRGVELYGSDTPENWQYVRELAIRYWKELDRHTLFDLTVVE